MQGFTQLSNYSGQGEDQQTESGDSVNAFPIESPSCQHAKPFLITDRIRHIIAGAIAELDLEQMRILRTKTPAQRVQQAASLIKAEALPLARISRLSQELKHRNMLVPPDIILDLLLQPEGDLPINAIHMDSGYKAELFLLRSGDVFRKTALARRRLVDMGPPLGQVYVHAPEDLILNKVQYYSLSYQSKHVRDIASIMVVSHGQVDIDYITHWSNALGLADAWQEMQKEIEKFLGRDG